MDGAVLIVNMNYNTYHVLYKGIIFNPIKSWDYQKLITAYPRVLTYTQQVATDRELIRDIARQYKEGHSYDTRFDELL